MLMLVVMLFVIFESQAFCNGWSKTLPYMSNALLPHLYGDFDF